MEGKKAFFMEDGSEEENVDDMRGCMKDVGESDYKPSIYDKYGKRALDITVWDK